MARDIDAVVAGHICFDLIPTFVKTAPTVGDLFAPGTVINMGPLSASTGGPVSNTGIALHRLGHRVALMAKVGDDLFGEAVLARLRGIGADEGMVVVPGGQTSYTVALAPAGIDRLFLHGTGVNDTFGAEDIRFDVVERARLFHLGYPPLLPRLCADGGKGLAETFRRAKETGVTTSLDMSLPDLDSPSGALDWPAVLKRTLPHVDLFVPSAEEALCMLNRGAFVQKRQEGGGQGTLDRITPTEISEMTRTCLAMGARATLIKCGHRGLCVRTAPVPSWAGTSTPTDESWRGRELWDPSFRVDKIAGATGSGDSAVAGFLASVLRGRPLEDALRIANAVGACNLGAPDALSGILPWEETEAKARADWEKNLLDLGVAGWSWDPDAQLWHGPDDRMPGQSDPGGR